MIRTDRSPTATLRPFFGFCPIQLGRHSPAPCSMPRVGLRYRRPGKGSVPLDQDLECASSKPRQDRKHQKKRARKRYRLRGVAVQIGVLAPFYGEWQGGAAD